MNDQFSNDSISSTISTDSPDSTEVKTGKGSMLVGSLVCGAVPALIVGFGAICYQTGYKEALNEARPTIVHGNQTVNNQKIYQITPSIGSNNNNNHQK
jgi:hypothetical protein